MGERLRLHIDLETYSDLPIGGSNGVGAFRYVDDPSFEILLFGYKIGDSPTTCLDLTQGDEIPKEVVDMIYDPGVVKVAFNAAFERHCLHKYFGKYLPPEQWEDTMILAANCGLPLKLEMCCEALHMSYYNDIVAGRVGNPILDAEYADLPADVSAELIRLDGMTEDYSFTPSSNPSKTYSVPGQKYHQYQIETDEQKDQFDALYMENYGQMMSAALQTSEYQAASDTGKAEILEETRDQVLEATKEQFFSWLDQNGATVERKPLPIDLPTEVAEEIYRLDDYTSDYSFAPSPSPSAKYTDPRRKDKEYVLDDAMKEEFTRIYTEVYAERAEEIMRKSKYRSANDAKKAAMLEEMRSEVLEETKDRFFDWLRDSGIESVKKEKD